MAIPATKYNTNAQSGAPKPIIIQCPACSTKFALSSEALNQGLTPKFHCSRCDTIFTQNFEPEPQEPFHEAEATHDSIKSPFDFHPSASNASEAMFNEPIAADSFDFSFSEDEDKLFTRFNTGTGPDSESELSVAKFDDEPMGYGSLARESINSHDPLAASEPSLIEKIQIPERFKAVAYLTAPCLLFLGVASLIAFISSISPSTIASAASMISSEKTIIAPRDIFVTNTKVKRIALDSGEMVSEITGTVVNKSADSLKEIEIEAAVFDRQNNQVGIDKAKTSSNIGKSRIQSLTPEMIIDLQNTSSARTFSVKPNQEAPFTAVVIEAPSKNGAPKSFIARVFSITKR